MKYFIVATIILFNAAEKIKCPLEIDTSLSCTKENQPVCAFSLEGSQLGTFENPCFACRIEKTSYYELDACIMTTKTSEPINQNSRTTSSTSSNIYVIYKCEIPKSDSPICPTVYQPTCGLFDPSIQCLKAPCGRQFGNQCEACFDKNIASYFYGNCDEIPQENPQNPPSEGITYCTEPRPEICTDEYTDTCAFKSTPCFLDTCMKSVGNYCDACSRKDIVGYVGQSCDKYKQLYTQDPAQRHCYQKPSSCDNIIKEVCATYACNDTTCQKEYKNECYACIESTTISYIQGKCQTLYETILSLTLFIQLII